MPSLLDRRTGPLQITLSLTREVNTFGQIANVGITLAGVNASYFDLPVLPAEFHFSPRNVTKIKSFHVESPPIATILADPAWLAVYIGLAGLGLAALQTLGTYANIKRGASELQNDVRHVVSVARKHVDGLVETVQGLTEDEIAQLQIGVYLWLDALTKAPERIMWRILRRAIKLRRLIMGTAGRALDIQVD